MENKNIYNNIPLYNDLEKLNSSKSIDVVDNKMLEIHNYLHRKLTLQEIYDYIIFIDFTCMDVKEYILISTYINEHNFKFFEPLFENENIRNSLIPLLSYDCVTQYKNYDLIVDKWSEYNIIKLNEVNNINTKIFDKYKINGDEYDHDYYKINNKIYHFVNIFKFNLSKNGVYIIDDLYQSIHNGNLDIFIYLVSSKIENFKLSEKDLEGILLDAIIHEKLDMIKYLCENKFVNIQKIVNEIIDNCLHKDNLEIIQYFLQYIDYDMNILLLGAVENNNFELVKHILDNNNNLNSNDQLLLLTFNKYNTFKILLDYGICKNDINTLNLLTNKAVEESNIKNFKLLLEAGADRKFFIQ